MNTNNGKEYMPSDNDNTPRRNEWGYYDDSGYYGSVEYWQEQIDKERRLLDAAVKRKSRTEATEKKRLEEIDRRTASIEVCKLKLDRARNRGHLNEQSKPSDQYVQENIKTKIVGVTYKNEDGTDRQKLLEELQECLRNGGTRQLSLKHEPDNQYSDHAIAVLNNLGEKLGYLEDELAGRLIDILLKARTVYADVRDITGGDGSNYGCDIWVSYEYDEDGEGEEDDREYDDGEENSDSTNGCVAIIVAIVCIPFVIAAIFLYWWIF